VTWRPVSIVPTSDEWTTVSVGLSGYSDSIIQIEFVWRETNTETSDQWSVDNVVVDVVTGTVLAPDVTVTPTRTNTDVTEVASPTEAVPTDTLEATDQASS